MSAVRNKGSKIESVMASFLKKYGIRYQSHPALLPGKPDFVIKNRKLVLFVDSCFWHGCRYHGSKPQNNKLFWRKKIARNKQRDCEVNREYKKMGWRVIRIWEHNINIKMTNKKMSDVLRVLQKNDRILL